MADMADNGLSIGTPNLDRLEHDAALQARHCAPMLCREAVHAAGVHVEPVHYSKGTKCQEALKADSTGVLCSEGLTPSNAQQASRAAQA